MIWQSVMARPECGVFEGIMATEAGPSRRVSPAIVSSNSPSIMLTTCSWGCACLGRSAPALICQCAKVRLAECTKWTSKPGKISRSGWLSSWIKGIDSILGTTSSGASRTTLSLQHCVFNTLSASLEIVQFDWKEDLSTRLHEGTFCETIRHRMKASVHLRMVLVAHFAIALLPCPKAKAEWWEHPHDKWYLKDDWNAADVEHYTPAFTMQNPAASGWVVVWGDNGVELSANGAVVMKELDRGLVYNADLTPFVRGARDVKLQFGPGRIVAEGELVDDQGRRYPFASGFG